MRNAGGNHRSGNKVAIGTGLYRTFMANSQIGQRGLIGLIGLIGPISPIGPIKNYKDTKTGGGETVSSCLCIKHFTPKVGVSELRVSRSSLL